MERRKFVIGLGALVAGSGAAMGTGAFTQVNAERQISVSTAGDDAAYLGLLENNDFGSYAEEEDGELTIDLDGVNLNSESLFQNIFSVQNNSPSGEIRVTIRKYDENGDLILGGDDESGEISGDSRVRFYEGWEYPPESTDRVDQFNESISTEFVDIGQGDPVDITMEVSTGTSGPGEPHHLEGREFEDSNPSKDDVMVDHIVVLAQKPNADF